MDTTTNGGTMDTKDGYREIGRNEVPAGSFRYGQLASVDGLDVPGDAWSIATDCHKSRGANGADGFDVVLVVHFLDTREADARYTAAKLAAGGNVGRVTLVRPAADDCADCEAVDDALRNGGSIPRGGCPVHGS